jgi:hypothetical protein
VKTANVVCVSSYKLVGGRLKKKEEKVLADLLWGVCEKSYMSTSDLDMCSNGSDYGVAPSKISGHQIGLSWPADGCRGIVVRHRKRDVRYSSTLRSVRILALRKLFWSATRQIMRNKTKVREIILRQRYWQVAGRPRMESPDSIDFIIGD